jgi:multiple sugar transport system substrate-binding protein
VGGSGRVSGAPAGVAGGRPAAGRLNRRRLLGRAAAGAAPGGPLALTLAACGPAGGTGSGSGAPGAGGSGPPASITFLGRESGSEVAVYKQGIEQFNAAQGRVRVAHDLATGNFDQKLQTLVAAGTPPDAHYMHSQTVPTYVALGVPAPLDAYNRKDKALDGLLPTALDAYRFKGAVFGVPDVATSYVMYVNRALFDQIGLPIPGEKWTWSDYTSTAQRIVNAARGEPMFATANYVADDSWPTVLWQNGADILNKDRNAIVFDRPEAVDALSWIADQIAKTRVHPAPADLGGKTAEQFFLDGKAAMLPTYSSRMGNIAKGAQFEVETVHLPQGKQRVTRTACGGSAMTKAGKSPDASWQFLRYLAGEEFQWLMARVGGIIFPAHKKVAESPDLFAAGQFTRSPKVTVDAMAYARVEPYVPRYLDLKAAIVKELGTVWNGESSVKDALTRAKAAADPILADGLSQIK